MKWAEATVMMVNNNDDADIAVYLFTKVPSDNLCCVIIIIALLLKRIMGSNRWFSSAQKCSWGFARTYFILFFTFKINSAKWNDWEKPTALLSKKWRVSEEMMLPKNMSDGEKESLIYWWCRKCARVVQGCAWTAHSTITFKLSVERRCLRSPTEWALHKISTWSLTQNSGRHCCWCSCAGYSDKNQLLGGGKNPLRFIRISDGSVGVLDPNAKFYIPNL